MFLNGKAINNELICKVAGISESELLEAKSILAPRRRACRLENAANSSGNRNKEMEATVAKGHPATIPIGGNQSKPSVAHASPDNNHKTDTTKVKADGASGASSHKTDSTTQGSGMAHAAAARAASAPPQTEYTKEQKERARVIAEIETTINNINNYKNGLYDSPQLEINPYLTL